MFELYTLSSFRTVDRYIGSYRRPPPLPRLETSTAWAALHGCAMFGAAAELPSVAELCSSCCWASNLLESETSGPRLREY